MRYRVEVLVEVEVEADNDTAARAAAYMEITFGTDVWVREFGEVEELDDD